MKGTPRRSTSAKTSLPHPPSGVKDTPRFWTAQPHGLYSGDQPGAVLDSADTVTQTKPLDRRSTMTRQSSSPSRRRFVAGSAALPALLAAAVGQGEAQEQPAAGTAPARPLNIVCVGAHPDDPESGCGGTLARYAT